METKAKKFKIKEPEENVEYSFIFPGRKIYTYLYYGKNDKGRYVLYNVKTKTFTTMTAGWFSKLCKKQLISKKPTKEPNVKENETLEMSKKIDVVDVANETTESFENRIIRELRSLSGSMEMTVTAKIGRSPSALANDLERIQKNPNEYLDVYVNHVMQEMMVARDCYLKINL